MFARSKRALDRSLGVRELSQERHLASLFFSYSHADENLRDQLERHLSALKHQGVIETWHDRRIPAGRTLGTEIDVHLEAADVILLLVSSDFLASEYCYDREMKYAMERHDRGAAVVIPVILRPCDWHDTPFGKLLATPKDGRPITQWPSPDEAFLDVVRAIKSALVYRETRSGSRTHESGPVTVPPSSPPIRSSNLRVAKRFSQLDKDRFLHEGFEYLAKYFENSLEELTARNPDIDQTFRRIDANRFAATAYRQGAKICRCSVFLEAMTSGIAYATNDDARSGSFNEALSVETDDQSVFFKSLGMQSMAQSREKLSFQGAAELFWGLFIRPIQ
jgi:TIR domain